MLNSKRSVTAEVAKDKQSERQTVVSSKRTSIQSGQPVVPKLQLNILKKDLPPMPQSLVTSQANSTKAEDQAKSFNFTLEGLN